MQKLEFDWEMNIPIYQYRGWDKSPSLDIVFGLSSKTQWLSGLYYADFISYTALLNCAEVGRRNRILTNYRFLSHSLFLSHENNF